MGEGFISQFDYKRHSDDHVPISTESEAHWRDLHESLWTELDSSGHSVESLQQVLSEF